MIFGPLTQLRLKGTFCPCILSDEESVAKTSDAAISNICENIRWHQSMKNSSSGDDEDYENEEEADMEQNKKSGGAFGFISNIIPKGFAAAATSTVTGGRSILVDGSCKFVDGGLLEKSKGIVLEITVDTQQNQNVDKKIQQKLRIPLRKIGAVRVYNSSGVAMPGWTNINASGEHQSSQAENIVSIYKKSSDGQGEELARLEIISLQSQSKSGALTMTREDVVEHFNNVLDWDRARRSNEDNFEEDEDDDDNKAKTGLRGRAQKAAHFAKREIEMQKMKREREQRKAKYVKEAGGLKYTALAMANREG